MKRDVIIACDFSDRRTTLDFLDRFPAGQKPFVKIGMELFYAANTQKREKTPSVGCIFSQLPAIFMRTTSIIAALMNKWRIRSFTISSCRSLEALYFRYS